MLGDAASPPTARADWTQPADDGSRESPLTRTLKILVLVVLAIFALAKAEPILVPLTFAALVAMLVSPLVAKLQRGVPRGIAIALVALLVAGGLVGILGLIGQQLTDFTSEWPTIKERAFELVDRGQDRLAELFGITEAEIEERIDERLSSSGSTAADAVRSFAGSLTGFLTDALLFFVYLILLLASERRLRTFVLAKADLHGNSEDAADAMDDVRQVAGEYLRGRLFLIAVLFGLYLAGFFWAGLKFAAVIAAIAALMSFVPYVGNVAAALLVVAVAAVSGEDFPRTVGICLGTMALAQVLESYVLTPLIVGKGVDLNPLATILAVVVFGSLWGLGGAVLAIPIVAIVRQVLGHLPRGREWAYLLSDSSPEALDLRTSPPSPARA